MACHHSTNSRDLECVGWLHNQLGVGNNIPLRLSMGNYESAELEVLGEQKKTFEETFEGKA